MVIASTSSGRRRGSREPRTARPRRVVSSRRDRLSRGARRGYRRLRWSQSRGVLDRRLVPFVLIPKHARPTIRQGVGSLPPPSSEQALRHLCPICPTDANEGGGIWAMTMMPIRDVSLFVEVIGRGHPLLLMHGGPGADHWSMTAVPASGRSVHARLLRPPLQRPLDRCAGDVDDLGEPDRRRRRAAREARLRAVGRARSLVRRPRRPRVRAPLSGAACRTSSCSTPAATADGRRRMRRRSSPARVRREDRGRRSALVQRADRARTTSCRP